MWQHKKFVVLAAMAVVLVLYMGLHLRDARKDLANGQVRGERDAQKDLASGQYIQLGYGLTLPWTSVFNQSATLGMTFLKMDMLLPQDMRCLRTGILALELPFCNQLKEQCLALAKRRAGLVPKHRKLWPFMAIDGGLATKWPQFSVRENWRAKGVLCEDTANTRSIVCRKPVTGQRSNQLNYVPRNIFLDLTESLAGSGVCRFRIQRTVCIPRPT
jgi:hypothetical protein